jgi:hypothetical protein
VESENSRISLKLFQQAVNLVPFFLFSFIILQQYNNINPYKLNYDKFFMSITAYTLIATPVKLEVNPSNIVRHSQKPSGIELNLVRLDAGTAFIEVSLLLEGSSADPHKQVVEHIRLGGMSDSDALREYLLRKKKIEQGKYLLHQYDDGSIHLELKSDQFTP